MKMVMTYHHDSHLILVEDQQNMEQHGWMVFENRNFTYASLVWKVAITSEDTTASHVVAA